MYGHVAETVEDGRYRLRGREQLLKTVGDLEASRCIETLELREKAVKVL